jgi:hypothetical protein
MNNYINTSKISFFTLIACLVAIYSCKTMNLTGEWKDNAYKGGPLKKYIVIGLYKNLSTRQTIESSIQEALKKNGVDAINSLSVLTPDRVISKNDKDLDDFMHLLKIDGILIIRQTGTQKKEKYIQGSSYNSAIPGVPFNGPYMSYYYNYYQTVSTPGYYEDFVSEIIECTLFENSSNKLVWRAELESIPFEEGSKEFIIPVKTGKDMAKIIVDKLKKEGFIAIK